MAADRPAVADYDRSAYAEDADPRVAYLNDVIDALGGEAAIARLDRPTAEYVPAYMSDDEEQFPAVLRCPVCSTTAIYEVDRAERWTDIAYGATDDPALVHVYYDGHGDYESVHLLCHNMHELDYPDNWSEVLSEN